uniref:Uncharacterized protein n=1 Tax=mine drainage metagenome TaxID=410659 RepID=E6Q313_9ZZZZ
MQHDFSREACCDRHPWAARDLCDFQAAFLARADVQLPEPRSFAITVNHAVPRPSNRLNQPEV